MGAKILWVDDEIDLLKPHMIFLEEKGYNVETCQSGDEAIDLLNRYNFDIIFLDENMPGLSGIETLSKINDKNLGIPVIMITKSEEESIMNEAIGSNIADYLIKPVNPNQILLSIKKNLENRKLIEEKTSMSYQQEFRDISMSINDKLNHKQWKEIYKKLVNWELKLQQSDDPGMKDIIKMQKHEANNSFSRFIQNNYIDWVSGNAEVKPVMSHTLMKDAVLPLLRRDKKLFVILIDNLRYDQWKVLQSLLQDSYRVELDDVYYSILPTATQYSRNSIFAGLMPSEIKKKYPKYWIDENQEEYRNQYEAELLQEQFHRLGVDVKFSYHKILNLNAGKKLADNINNYISNPLNVIVYNFVDMLSHARTEMEVIKELADDEAAYRSLTKSWFMHSPLRKIMQFLSSKKINVIITTDHGAIQVSTPTKVVGDKNTSANLRYKTSRSIQFKKSEVFDIQKPGEAYLPTTNVNSKYIFAKGDGFFVYPNNYNYYVNYYKNTFQHGGVSLEEMLIPFIYLKAK